MGCCWAHHHHCCDWEGPYELGFEPAEAVLEILALGF
jgi:hypothetical protein